MVNQGNFSLRLINASTMEPLKEHSSSTGKTYVTLSSSVDFFVQVEDLRGDDNERAIFYQTSVSNSATTSRHNFKRRQPLNETTKHDVYRFDRSTAATASYESVVMEKVTVRVFEATADNGRKHLETITLQCCVIPSFQPALFGGRTTSVGSLLAKGNTFTNQPRGCWIKKNATSPIDAARSRLTPVKVPPPPPLVL